MTTVSSSAPSTGPIPAGPGPARWVEDDLLEVGDLTFTTGRRWDDAIPVIKPPALVRTYLDLLAAERPEVIVELGTKDGGSAALALAAARPAMLLTIDLAPEVPSPLVALREHPELGPRLEVLVGLDQGDADTLEEQVDRVLAGRAIDLVVDDASHVLAPTRTSFEVLFPRIRPGGLLVIEDWSSEAGVAASLALVVSPADPEWPERLALVRALFLRLNQPGYTPPPEVLEALGVAHRDRQPSPGGAGFAGILMALVDAAGRADLATLRALAMDPLPRPLVDLAVEMTMVAAVRPDVVASVAVSSDWIAVRRGPAPLSDGLDLGSLWNDHFGYLS